MQRRGRVKGSLAALALVGGLVFAGAACEAEGNGEDPLAPENEEAPGEAPGGEEGGELEE